jgi:hypothetical protein
MLIVPTLRVGMQDLTLCVYWICGATQIGGSQLADECDVSVTLDVPDPPYSSEVQPIPS